MEFTAEMIADFLKGEIVGDKDAKVSSMAKIEEGKEGALSFLSNPKYEPYIYTSKSTIIIVNKSFEPKDAVQATMVKVDDAYASFAKLLELYVANKPQKTGVHKLAAISDSAKVGKDCYIGEFAVIDDSAMVGDNCRIYPQVYIGEGVRIGNNVTLHSGVKIYEYCVIGNNVTIEAGAIIGADGFGWAPTEKGTFEKIPQIGNVVLEDDVYIGANTCVDCATMGSTLISKGVKLDNLIQIGHNVTIGENTVAAAQTGIAGSSKLGKNCMLGGQVGILGHITLGDRVQVGSKSGVSNSIPDGEVYFGSPAAQASKYHRSHAVFRNLPQMSLDVHNLKKAVEKITAQLEQK